MYKNKRYRASFHRTTLLSKTALLLLFVIPLAGCAKSRSRADSPDASDATIRENDEPTVGLPDSDIIDSTVDRLIPSTDDSRFEADKVGASRLPQDIVDDLETLTEPDFVKPIEELAAEKCGYLFTAESVIGSEQESYTINETRSFDSDGHLIAAEIRIPDRFQKAYVPFILNRRLQLDYDSNGRPELIRLSPMFDMQPSPSNGSVIRIDYQSDGSSVSRFVTNETSLVGTTLVFDYTVRESSGDAYFCEQLRFDKRGNFLERKWGCADPKVVQSRTYDDRNRVLSDQGFLQGFFTDLPAGECPLPIRWIDVMQNKEWQIDFAYDDSKHIHTIIWKEFEQERQARYETKIEPVEHRMVRTYDDSDARILSVDYDNGNDDAFDERTSYTYRDGQLVSKEIDLWCDGVVDITEIHTRSANSHRIERRNMTVGGDNASTSLSFDRPSAFFTDIRSVLPYQSQATTEIQYDENTRPIAIDLEMRRSWYVTEEWHWPEQWEQVAFSESWHESSVCHDQGYVKEKTLFWEPSEETREMQTTDPELRGLGDTPYLFRWSSNTTTCLLTPLCQNAEVTLPDDMRLLTCEVAFIFPEYQNVVDVPSVVRNEFVYTPPPYDMLPGIQNVMKRHHQIYGFPGPPNVRDLIDY